jgi:hypothetical protein
MKQSLRHPKELNLIAQYVILEALNVLKLSECGFQSRKRKKLPGTVSGE